MKNNTLLSIKLVGFNSAETGKFSAILNLAEFGLHYPWEITDAATAHFYLLKNQPDDQYTDEKSQNRCFYYRPLNHPEKAMAVFYDDNHVPLLHHLIALLNSSSEIFLQKKQEKIKELLNELLKKEKSFYSPPLLLKRLIEADTPLMIHVTSASGNEKLYINPEQQAFYYPHSVEKASTALLSDSNISVDPVTPDKLKKLMKNATTSAQPLRHLIWYATFTHSDGRLMQGLSEHDMIHLTEWPYLGTESRNYIKLATYLKKQVASLAQAKKASGINPAIANNFYNASQLAGLIEAHSSTTTAVELDESITEKPGFLAKIKQRLRH